MIHLDTSFLIRSLVRGTREDAALRRWLHGGESLAVSSLAWTEFLCGPVTPEVIDVAARLLGDPMPFGAPEAATAAQLFDESGRRRGTLVDCMIAASAIRHDAVLATANVADFQKLVDSGLELAAVDAPG